MFGGQVIRWGVRSNVRGSDHMLGDHVIFWRVRSYVEGSGLTLGGQVIRWEGRSYVGGSGQVVVSIERQLPTSRYSLPIWSCKKKFNITSFVSNILTIEVILKIHFLFLNCLQLSDKFLWITLLWSNFNCQPADTVFRFDPARQSSISPHLSVIS